MQLLVLVTPLALETIFCTRNAHYYKLFFFTNLRANRLYTDYTFGGAGGANNLDFLI
jgi:hypothetical protein